MTLTGCTGSSPGSERIHYEFLKKLSRPERLKLLKAYQRIWETGDFPANWTEAIVIPIPKPGKDPNKPDSYRPISLASCMCKLLEKIVNRRLMHTRKERNLLPL
jgi:hypothetical protein